MRRFQLPGVLILLLVLSLQPVHPANVRSKPVAVSSGWTTYHKDNTRNGYDASAPAFPASGQPGTQWSTPALDGALYAEPLVLSGVIYQATENNSIYAFDETTGTQIWRWHEFASVPGPAGAVGCGNINPVGITSTPVIDPALQIIYAVGLVSAAPATGTKYQLFALNLSNGSMVTGFPINITPAGLNPVYQIQRAALGLAPSGNTIYVAFGGWAGDCTPYHPFVVAIPVGTTLGSPMIVYQPQTSSQNGGGIWEPSGMSIDASGNVYVETGNGFWNTPTPCDNTKWDHGDSVLKLSPTLVELSFFAPVDWCALNAADADLGSVGPLLLANGQIFASGKSGDGWLLDSTNLGGFAGQLNSNTTIPNCSAVFGGFAYVAPYVYVPCEGTGLAALQIDAVNKSYSVAWSSSLTFQPSAPIVAGGVVWTMGSSQLFGFDAVTGNLRFGVAIGGHTRFATPTEDNGWVIVPEQTRVHAFAFSWNPLGGHLTSGPDAASWAAGHLDVFVRGADSALWRTFWNGTSWNAWESLGGSLTPDDPGAVSGTANRVDVFVRGVDNGLWHRWWNGSAWSPWENLGGRLNAGPDASSWGATRLDVFVRGVDNALWHRWWDGAAWQPWEYLGGVLTSDPGAVSSGANQLDVFARGADNAIWHRSWNGSTWSAWQSLGGRVTSEPDVSSCAAGKLDVFAVGADAGLWRKSFNGTTWGAWTSLGGRWTSGPGAVCQPTTTKIDLFERGTDNGLWTQELPN